MFAEAVAHLQGPARGVPAFFETLAAFSQPPGEFEVFCAVHGFPEIGMRLDPGVKCHAANGKRRSDFGFAVALCRKFKHALAICGSVAGPAPSPARRQDFEFGAHGTSQVILRFD